MLVLNGKYIVANGNLPKLKFSYIGDNKMLSPTGEIIPVYDETSWILVETIASETTKNLKDEQ